MITMNNCNPSLINALSLCDFYSPKKAQPLITIFCMKWVVGCKIALYLYLKLLSYYISHLY